MNPKIKLSSLSESLRKQVKLQMNEGSSKLSQMPKDLKRMILKEMADMGEAPINETGPGDEAYIDGEFGPLLADEDQYGFHMQVRSTNAKTKFMSLNKNQLLGIIDAIKRG